MSKQDVNPLTIFVAHDGSPVAQTAACLAIEIAQVQKLPIQGLYVVDEILVLDPYANYQAELGRDAKKLSSRNELVSWFEQQGEAALQWLEISCQAVDVPVTTDLLFGGVPELIIKESTPSQLLAMGRRGHGHTANSDYLGRNFRDIAHHVRDRPMLVGGDEMRQIQRVLLVFDGSERAQQALAWTSWLQRSLSTEVMVLSIPEEKDTERSQQWLALMQSDLEQSDLTNYRFLTGDGQPAAAIVQVAAENEADLIVIGGYRHTTLVEWLVGSNVDQVLRNTQLPVLVT
jgi:nucleotide-binding universal stress UspA family protein